MEIAMPHAIILTGDGINCDSETEAAFKKAGARTTRLHINKLLKEPDLLKTAEIFCIPGGFSFGDDLGSGRVLAIKLKHGLGQVIEDYRKNGGLILGICNGFQVLVKMGILSTEGEAQSNPDLTLTTNNPEGFINKWTSLVTNPFSPCVWTRDLKTFELPIRHGEGRLVVSDSMPEKCRKFLDSELIVLKYSEDINGSVEKIAAVCDKSGRVFGLMPHPEAYQSVNLGPSWNRKKRHGSDHTSGQKIFINGVNEARLMLQNKEVSQ